MGGGGISGVVHDITGAATGTMFFGGGGGGGGGAVTGEANSLMNRQILLQKQEYARELAALGKQQFNAIKAQGTFDWDAAKPTGISGTTKEEWNISHQ